MAFPCTRVIYSEYRFTIPTQTFRHIKVFACLQANTWNVISNTLHELRQTVSRWYYLDNVCSVRCRHKVERQMIVAAKLETFLSHLFLHTCKHMEFKIWQATCLWNVPIHEDYLTSIQCIVCTFPFIPYSTSFMKSMLGMVRSTDKKFTFSLGS